MRKTLEAQETLFRRGFPTLQASLTFPELPPRAPAFAERKFGSLCSLRVLLGEVFCRIGRCESFAECGFALVSQVECDQTGLYIGRLALHKRSSKKGTERHTGRSLQCDRFDASAHPSQKASRSPIGREAAPSKNHLPPEIKNFPPEHPPKQSETNLHSAKAGALGGSSR